MDFLIFYDGLLAFVCCLMSAYAKGLYNINLYIYLVDTPLTFGTFNICPEVISLLITPIKLYSNALEEKLSLKIIGESQVFMLGKIS